MSAPSQPPPPRTGGLSLYAELLESSADPSATISSAPVLYQAGEDQQAATKKPVDSALRFQPIRRPQVKPKPKPGFTKTTPGAIPSKPAPPSEADPSSTSAAPSSAAAPPNPPPPPKTRLSDWAPTEEDEWRYGAAAPEKRQRGGRKNKKKQRQEEQAQTDWGEMYDPARPTNVDEYLRSDERIREVHEWKDLLYRHRAGGEKGAQSDSDEDGDSRPMPSQFAPPPNLAFAPPPPSPPRAPVPDDKTGDDAYARRLALSQGAHPPPSTSALPQPTPEEQQGIIISRAPVRYSPQPPPAQDSDPDSEGEYRPTLGLGADAPQRVPEEEGEDQPRSNRPGQKGFAQRLMSKYGWTKGTGLGADESGILNPLRVQVEKRKKKSDAEGGGWAEPAPRSKILGGKRKAAGDAGEEGAGGPGSMSEVIVLRNMLEGMEDLRGEIAAGLGQEIGEECGDKYGRVERLYIDVDSRQVFIKFTDQVSALRAVNELKGRIFNGNAIEPRFFNVDQFEKGVYH